ncbi:MAG: PH domain-containing protein [Pseudonocardiaceae bacterium]
MIGRHAEILLDPSLERRVIRVRRHWAVLLSALSQTVGIVLGVFLVSLLAGGGAGLWLVQSVLWCVAVGVLLRLAWKVLRWWHEVLIVTDKRLMINSDIVQTKNSMMSIAKVTDMVFSRPFFGRLLGYGTLLLESTGQTRDLEKIEFVSKPEEVFLAISELLYGDKKRPPSSHMLDPPRIFRRGRWRIGQ